MNASRWRIFENGIGGWYAWNAHTRRQIDLVSVGSFSDAVGAFERLIGDYYGTR